MSNPIQWDQVKRELHENAQALKGSFDANPEQVQRIRLERAQRLARRRDKVESADSEVLYLITLLGQEKYALPLEQLGQVVKISKMTPVPGVAPEYLGLMNVGGEIRTIVSLSRLIRLESRSSAAEEIGGYAVFLKGSRLGLRVDQVNSIEKIENVHQASAKYVRGINSDQVMILDWPAVVSHSVFENDVLKGIG